MRALLADTCPNAGAQSFQVVTIIFSDPALTLGAQSDFQLVNSSVSFSFMPSYAISTLSTNSAVPGQDVTGLIYTPDLLPSDPCVRASAPYVPANVTRQGSLPNTDYDLVAVAPWISPACTLSYLQAARQDPVRGFLFYTPDNGTNTPPSAQDPTWDLGDGGAWESANPFPVYAIPGATGRLLMLESSMYSGNLTGVPFGHQLASSGYDPRDYVRLYIDIGTESANNLPGLWVFLLIVLGILLGIMAAASVLMHYLQRRRRQNLRRRIVTGEVDLEALGIQRLTVPQAVLDRMPLFEYGSGKPVEAYGFIGGQSVSRSDVEKHSPEIGLRNSTDSISAPSPEPAAQAAPLILPSQENHLHQPTCAICLDDFTAPSGDISGATVRQLPCQHIFHPDCVDAFLRDNSSLCPMCKSSALPIGYCPRLITNAMVRRESAMRRMRQRMAVDGSREEQRQGASWRRHRRGVSRISSLGRWRTVFDRGASSAPDSTDGRAMTDLSSLPQTEQRSARSLATLPRPPANPAGRREWARQRALAMLGRHTAPVDPAAAERRSGWRKVLSGVWPGIA